MSRSAKTIMILAALGTFAWLQYLIDDNLGTGWPHNAVNNWEQFGLLNLHGRLVINPGGYQALTSPELYSGMSPVCLYPVYFASQLFAWTGGGTLPFQILLALMVFWAIRSLLGRDSLAQAAATAAILCPGYGRWLDILDPNDISVLFSLPYIAILLAILNRPKLGFAAGAGLLALTLAFTSLNWTTTWVMGPCALLLLGLPQVNRRRVLVLIGLAGVSSVLFAIASVAAKTGHGHAGNGSLLTFLRGYTWGNTGYGTGLTTTSAFVRLAFVNGVGLLPLIVLGGWAASVYFRSGHRKNWFTLSPFALTVLEVAFMRNYFGHHPWMAAPLLLVGLVFSLTLLRAGAERDAPASLRKIPGWMVPGVFLLCLVYGLTVTTFSRAKSADGRMLVSLVRQHTDRSDCIVIVKSLDPRTAQIAARLDETLDRRVVLVDNLDHLPAGDSRKVILSAVPATGGLKLRAQTADSANAANSWPEAVGDWFNRAISRRQPGDRMDFARAYFLYEPNP